MDAVTLAAPAPQAAKTPRPWLNRFLELGDAFLTRLQAERLPDPRWVAMSPDCAALLGFPTDWASRPDWAALEVFSGNAVWPGMVPLASVYAGHQFGVWAGQLGDGRALWLGELETGSGPLELQLKGSGRTPYSRMGDGRAVLRSSISEFLACEAMAALGVPTTRALCVTGSPLPVRREVTESAAVITRVAPSFIRFGHFEHFAARGETTELRRLADFVINHHLPECRAAAQPYAALLHAIALRTATLLAHWQSIGFTHGVMNTDNMSVLGLTIDYGPFTFLDGFDPRHVGNHSDVEGRYAWSRQPNAALWNLHALGEALLPLIGSAEPVLASLDACRDAFIREFDARLAAKLGFTTAEDGDRALGEELLTLMATCRSDFTATFRRLADFDRAAGPDDALRALFRDAAAFQSWAARYAERLAREDVDPAARRARMQRINPKYVLRNHLAEVAIRRAQDGDFGEVERLRAVLSRPFDEQPGLDAYAEPPAMGAARTELSCSS